MTPIYDETWELTLWGGEKIQIVVRIRFGDPTVAESVQAGRPIKIHRDDDWIFTPLIVRATKLDSKIIS